MADDLTIGVDLGGTKLLIVSNEKHFRISTGSAFTSAQLEDQIRKIINALNVNPSGIGIAIPGLVDATGCIKACDVLPQMVGWNPTKAFADFNCPVRAINDVKAALLEEFHDAGANLTAGVVMVGTAVGGAFQVEGLPLLGANGWAGEIGYMPISIGGEVKRLDELAGGAFMAQRLGIDSETLVQRIQADDPEARSIVREGGYALGLALASVINILNPSKLIIGGGTLKLNGYEEAVYDAAKRFSLPELWEGCSLSRVKSGDAVVALGAARYVALDNAK